MQTLHIRRASVSQQKSLQPPRRPRRTGKPNRECGRWPLQRGALRGVPCIYAWLESIILGDAVNTAACMEHATSSSELVGSLRTLSTGQAARPFLRDAEVALRCSTTARLGCLDPDRSGFPCCDLHWCSKELPPPRRVTRPIQEGLLDRSYLGLRRFMHAATFSAGPGSARPAR